MDRSEALARERPGGLSGDVRLVEEIGQLGQLGAQMIGDLSPLAPGRLGVVLGEGEAVVRRGSLVDEVALITDLKDGRFGRAALNVFAEEPTPPETPGRDAQRVAFSMRGGRSRESVPRIVAQAIENVRRYRAGEPGSVSVGA